MARFLTNLLVAAGVVLATSSSALAQNYQAWESQQQSQINQAVSNGLLSPQEAAKLQAKQAKVQAEQQLFMAQNGGVLTQDQNNQIQNELRGIQRGFQKGIARNGQLPYIPGNGVAPILNGSASVNGNPFSNLGSYINGVPFINSTPSVNGNPYLTGAAYSPVGAYGGYGGGRCGAGISQSSGYGNGNRWLNGYGNGNGNGNGDGWGNGCGNGWGNGYHHRHHNWRRDNWQQ